MIVKDLHAFSIVEDEGFKEFVKKLDPTYVLTTRKTVKSMVRGVSASQLICGPPSLWSPIWVTYHYTDSNTELGSVVLGVSKFPKSHTADNIKEALSDLISDRGLTGSERPPPTRAVRYGQKIYITIFLFFFDFDFNHDFDTNRHALSHILFLHILLVLHILFCTFLYSITHFTLYFFFFTYIYALVWCYFYIFFILCTVH